ncbi:MAG: EamA family transporter [Actinobacteria bacterium]|nr:EamA family transporter [Actinomycetota bacterium]
MTAVLLALLTAASYGVANYLGPLLSRRLPLSGVLLVGQSVGVLGGLLLVAVTGFGSPGRSGLLLGAAAGTANAVALASFYRAAALGPISIVAPIGATGAVVPVLVGIVGGERPSLLQLVGIPLAVAGVALAAARQAPAAVPRRDVSAAAVPGLLLVVGTIAYGIATTRGLVSVVSVLATLSPVVTVGLAVLVLGERLAGRQRLGVAVALLGVVLLAAG